MLVDAGRDQFMGLKNVQRVLAKDGDRLLGILLGLTQHMTAILPSDGTEQQRRDE